MYNNPYNNFGRRPISYGNRLIGGGFLAPFVLGGITGGLLAPAFGPRPFYGPGPFYGPRPFYGPPIYY